MNNCQHCDHKTNNPDGGHCYMFRVEPKGPCAHHTVRVVSTIAMRLQIAHRIAEQLKGK